MYNRQVKKFALLLLGVIILIVGVQFFISRKEPDILKKIQPKTSSQYTHQGPVLSSQQSLFVPYWTVSHNEKIDGNYDALIYFGITPDTSGIDTTDSGYANIATFLTAAGNQKKILAVTMVDKEFNSSVLRDPSLQQKIINQSIEIAEKNGFDGILLDYESSALAFDTVVNRISTFSNTFYKNAHAKNLSYDVALYGDTFFRSRPYNVKDIAQHSDRIFIMAYDFHKSNGDPGPNFPLYGKNTYGYDFTSLMTDFTREVRPDKLTVVFGMFGYDWQVNSKGESEDAGISVSDNNAQKRFLSECNFTQCVVTRDPISTETKVTYRDSDKQLHEVWFEDKNSVQKKEQYLHNLGVYSTSFWAYSFF